MQSALKNRLRKIVSIVLCINMIISLANGIAGLRVYADVNLSELTAVSVEGNTYYTDRHGLMAYRCTNNGVDIIGKVGGEWRKVTYGYGGFNLYYRINSVDRMGVAVNFSSSSDETTIHNNTLNVQRELTFSDDGQLITINYHVKNRSSVNISGFDLGIRADTMIYKNDYSLNEPLTLEEGGDVLGFVMTDDKYGVIVDGKNTYVTFMLACKGVGSIDATNYWYGQYNSHYPFTDESPNGARVDSAIAYSWRGQTLAAGEEKCFTTVAGVGDISTLKESLKNLTAKVDYEKEIISGLEAGNRYKVTIDADSQTYIIEADETGNIPLSGIDRTGKEYSLIGNSFSIVQIDEKGKETSEESKIDVVTRPGTPDNPNIGDSKENAAASPEEAKRSDVVIAVDRITIKSPVEGQEYSVDGGNTWKIAEGNDTLTFTGLVANTDYTIITRVKATNTSPASLPSTGVTITYEERTAYAEVTASNINVTYDGKAHSIEVNADGATITYSKEFESNYNAKKPEFTDACDAQTVYYRVERAGYYPVYGSATVTIAKKVIGITWGENEFTYNGSVQTPTAVATGVLDGDTINIQVSGGKKEYSASTYIATATALTGEGSENYSLPNDTTKSFTIAQRIAELSFDNTNLTYNGQTQVPTAVVTNKVEGDVCNVTVDGSQINVGENYTATAIALSNSNYKLPATNTDKMTTFTIVPKSITASMVVLDSSDGSYTFTGRDITPFITAFDNERSVVLTAGENGDYDLSGDTKANAFGNYQLILTGKNNYKGNVILRWNVTDPNPPRGNINITTNNWNSFLNGVTCGLFFNETKQVTITGSDGVGESGIDKIYYHTSETELNQSALVSLADSAWTEISNGGSFNIIPNTELIVYAKIIDKVGNVSIINSEGLVFDNIKPEITGIRDGKTYCDAKTITVTDTNLDSVTVNGKKVTLTDGKYELAAADKSYIIIATDKAGNSSKVKVTVNKGHKFGEYISNNNASTQQNCTETAKCQFCDATDTKEIPNTKVKVTINTEEKDNGDVGNGKIVTEVNVDSNVPSTEISKLTVELAKNLLTDEEFEESKNGETIVVYLDVIDINENVSEGDKTEVEKMVATEDGNVGVPYYIDLSLYKKVGDGYAIKLTETGVTKLTVSIVIPEYMMNKPDGVSRTYNVVRVHKNANGTVETTYLNSSETAGVLTFETDKFSTYAITYVDTQHTTGITVTPDNRTLTKKGETVQLVATVTPDDAVDKSINWKSSNEKVVTVDENGMVTAVGNGTATISVITVDGGKSATATITVSIPSPKPDEPKPEKPKPEKPTGEVPRTGDKSRPFLWLMFAFFSGTELILVVRKINFGKR